MDSRLLVGEGFCFSTRVFGGSRKKHSGEMHRQVLGQYVKRESPLPQSLSPWMTQIVTPRSGQASNCWFMLLQQPHIVRIVATGADRQKLSKRVLLLRVAIKRSQVCYAGWRHHVAYTHFKPKLPFVSRIQNQEQEQAGPETEQRSFGQINDKAICNEILKPAIKKGRLSGGRWPQRQMGRKTSA